MAPVKLAIGVDGGGTSTTCVALDAATGEEKGRGVSGSSNANSVGFEAAFEAVMTAVREAVGNALRGEGCDDVRPETVLEGIVPEDSQGQVVVVAAVVLTCAGVDRDADKARWVDAIANRCRGCRGAVSTSASKQDEKITTTNIVVDNDAIGALASGTEGDLRSGGAVLVAGTGTIAFGVTPSGHRARAAGWGPAFDDRGSGHHIASRGLAVAARAADGRAHPPDTRLLPDILAHLGLSTPDELIPWAYSGGPAPEWSEVARLAPVVLAAAEAGDAAATKIVEEAVEGLAESVVAVFEEMSRNDGIDGGGGGGQCALVLVLVGGILSEGGIVAKHLEAAVNANRYSFDLARVRLVHPKVGPETGAAFMACRMISGDDWKPSKGASSVCPDRG